MNQIILNLMVKTFLCLGFVLEGCSQTTLEDQIDDSALANDYEYVAPCAPCQTQASRTAINEGEDNWPTISSGELLKINSLTDYKYELATGAYHNSYWGVKPWWSKNGLDPWSEFPYWGDDYVAPNHRFERCVDDDIRWMCGYSYVVETPENYSEDKKYPLVIFLHGTIESNVGNFQFREGIRKSFFYSEDDPYVYAAPIKLEIDWDSKKISDVIENIKQNMNIDEKRIYLTGLSMGGRGTFIVAADLPDTFAAIMPLSPHHGPYSYVSLANKVKHIPIWMSHGKNDAISSYSMAQKMADSLEANGANIKFESPNSGHWGWESIYSKASNINWLLSWKLE